MMVRAGKEIRMYPLRFVFPVLGLYILFFLLPGLSGIWYSFTDWSTFHEDVNFVGLRNYIQIFTSSNDYSRYIGNTVRFTVISNMVKIIPAFFLALMFNHAMKGRNVYRAILYFPSALPYLVTGLIFRSILHPGNGLLNKLLGSIGLGFLQQEWLADPGIVWSSIFAVDAWRGIGYVMTIFLAGLQAIPAELYESADIDGAGFWRKLLHVTVPMVIPSFTINLTFGLAYGLKVFDVIYVLTNGGPGRETEVLGTAVFREFSNGNYAISSTLNTLLFVFMAILACFIVTRLNKRTVEL
ncbi:MAG: sugar ABC transporter permease [Treponema sp.]|jgi:raffinose/stachyose/melibiose transport system permease protein|nr:sugar ABC transporter permease [Treponema sp.]